MGGLCTNTATELPSYSETVQGTNLPAFVAAGGKEIYEQARELAQSEFPQFTGERIATYGTGEDGVVVPFIEASNSNKGEWELKCYDADYKLMEEHSVQIKHISPAHGSDGLYASSVFVSMENNQKLSKPDILFKKY